MELYGKLGLLVTSAISTLYGIVWQTVGLLVTSAISNNVWQTAWSLGYICHLQQSPHCLELYGKLGVSWLHLPYPTISTLFRIVWQTGGVLVTSAISNNLHIVWQSGGSLGYICHLHHSLHYFHFADLFVAPGYGQFQMRFHYGAILLSK